MLERAIEATLFLLPILVFFAWRFVLAARVPPGWMLTPGIVVMLLLIAALVWVHQQDQDNADRAYVPATVQHGDVVSGHPGPSLSPPALDGHGSQN